MAYRLSRVSHTHTVALDLLQRTLCEVAEECRADLMEYSQYSWDDDKRSGQVKDAYVRRLGTLKYIINQVRLTSAKLEEHINNYKHYEAEAETRDRNARYRKRPA